MELPCVMAIRKGWEGDGWEGLRTRYGIGEIRIAKAQSNGWGVVEDMGCCGGARM